MKRWQKKRIFVVDVAVFKVDVLVAVDCGEKDVLAWFKKHGAAKHDEVKEVISEWDEDSKTSTLGRMYQASGGFIVFLKSHQSWIEMFGLLVHEMTHVTQYLLKDRRVPLSMDTDEVHAYLVEYLVKSVAREIL